MVPVKLVLKNFMCYKNAMLDLDGIHLVCLSGDNGSGKSAILDAITWTLWGKARASDDELIAQGEIEMQTDMEFKVNEILYRIVRTRTRKGAGHTELSFQIRTPEGGWRNIGGNTKRATQDEIIKALRMEYETFINSAFLLQGRADEFTTKTPGERKRVLAEILGLGYYDDLETRAKEEAREAESRRKRLDERLQELGAELARRPAYESQKRQGETELLAGREILTTAEGELVELQSRESVLRLKESQRQDALKRLETVRSDLARTGQDLARNEFQTEQCREVIGRKAEIEAGFREWQLVEREYETMTRKFDQYRQLLTRRHELEGIVSRAQATLEADQRNARAGLKEAEEQSRSLPGLEKDFAALQTEVAEAAKRAEELEGKRTERQAVTTRHELLSLEARKLSQQLEEIKARAGQVPAAGERCDRCGTLLDEAARDHTLEERRREYRECQATVKENKINLEGLRASLEVLDRIVRDLEGPARRLATLQKNFGTLEQKLAQARHADEKASLLRQKSAELAAQLEGKTFSQKERGQLADLNQQAQELAWDDETYQRVKGRLNILKKFDQQMVSLEQAQLMIVELHKRATELEQRQAELRQEETTSQTQALSLQAEVAGLSEVVQRREAAQGRRAEAESSVKLFQRQLWEAESQLKRLDELDAERKLKNGAFQEAANQKSVFGELTEAFGKKGLQALIIDTVLPELEEETNRLLGNMSDGRMTVRFDTLRDSKKGDAIETLDLKISDEAGVRSYELFSGGEAFRVNFAVRVALSKLLARRSGAALQTLVIDEGFGSQDGPGRERLVEAIRSIEDDFKRVIIITHIQELKDVFPVRIDITKTATGSTISVN